jgi:hypothetical protein
MPDAELQQVPFQLSFDKRLSLVASNVFQGVRFSQHGAARLPHFHGLIPVGHLLLRITLNHPAGSVPFRETVK